MQIIRATPDDVDTLFALSWKTFHEAFHHLNKEENMKAYMSKAFTREKLLSELQNENSEFYFAKKGKAIIGYIKLNRKEAQSEFHGGDSLEIERIYIDAAYQGKGFGTKMLDTIKEIARDTGCDYIWLGVWENNPAAIRLYERNGFEIFSSHQFVMGDDVQMDKLMIYKLPSSSAREP